MWIKIERNNHITIIQQLYTSLQNKILSGELKADEKLPSTRELAASLNISRNIVIETYQQLEAEGFLYTKVKSGTFVSKGIQLKVSKTDTSKKASYEEKKNSYINLRSGIPDLSKVPIKKWLTYYSHAAFYSKSDILGYENGQGLYSLRLAICNYLKRVRGLLCSPQQIVITTGSMYSFHILASALIKKNNSDYIVEDPIHTEILKVFNNISTKSIPVSVDKYGIIVNKIPKEINPSFIYTTPSHQYPCGWCLSIKRRIELINYAKEHNTYIIEDDYDSEFRYTGTPISAMFSLCPQNVIYTGTFSKIFFPSVRLAYMVLPMNLVSDIVHEVRYSSYFVDTLSQIAMTHFLDEHILEHHINKMKKLYIRKRNYLIDLLNNFLKDEITIEGKMTGLHLIVKFKNRTFTDEKILEYKKQGLLIYPVYKYSSDKNYKKNSLIFGYSHLSKDEIYKAVLILSK